MPQESEPGFSEELPLSATFCGLAGLGEESERRLWEGGILCWNDAMREHSLLHPQHTCRLREEIVLIRGILASDDRCRLVDAISGTSQARLLPALGGQLAFLDIETTGLDARASITVATVFDRRGLRVFIRGLDLDELPDWLEDSSVLVTYGGSRFDLPFLRRSFGIRLTQPHIDLSRWHSRNGLKEIEKRYGMVRRYSEGLQGTDAIRLWNDYCGGNQDALQRLITYNIEDVLSLEHIIRRQYHNGMSRYPLGYPSCRPMAVSEFICSDSGIAFTA